MEKFLIIDGNSILNRAFYGVNARMTSKYAGIHTNAIYGFLNIFWMIKDNFSPDYIAVTFDLAKPTFRHEMYKEYKGTRKGMPDELREQLPIIKEVLQALNVEIIEKEGFEADDILGTVSKINEKNGIFTYILSGDRDTFQLISNVTNVIHPKSGMRATEYLVYNEDLLMETYSIKPYQIIETKSLMGDASDNIPGVKGIGEKTAYSLITKYDTLDNIYKNIDNNSLDVSDKIKEKLLIDKDMAYLSKTLATIILDADITVDYEKCKVHDIDYQKTYAIFKKLEFNKFLEKFEFSKVSENFDYNSNVDEKNYQEFKEAKNTLVINNQNINEKIDYIKNILQNGKVAYLYNNPSLNYFIKSIKSDKEILALYNDKNDEVIIIDLESILKNNKELYGLIIKTFLNSNSEKIGYNIKQDIRYFFSFVDDFDKFKDDIMIIYYLLDATRSDYLLEYILNDIFGIILKSEEKKDVQLDLFSTALLDESDSNISQVDISNIGTIVKAIYLSRGTLYSKLEKENMMSLYKDIEMPLVVTLASMEHVGMHVNREKIDIFDKEITSRINELTLKIYEIAGEEFNINSTKQLGAILFEKLGLKGGRKTKTGYSTDKEVLESLEGEHEIISNILEYRMLAKLKSTYVDGLIDKIGEDSKIHTTFMQTVTSTGRLSSIEPNLQNIPIRQELGGKIRTFFDTSNKNNIIIDADYSQIELRMLAHVSNDEKMCEAFNNNIDIHTSTASEVFGVEKEDVTPILRRNAKAVNFGIVYGISEYGLAKNINVTPKEAKKPAARPVTMPATAPKIFLVTEVTLHMHVKQTLLFRVQNTWRE